MSLEDKLYPLLKVYDSVPSGVKSFLGAAYRMLPEKWKWGEGYSKFKRLNRELLDWDEEDIREYQLKQIRSTLLRAQNSCPWYQNAFSQAGFRPEKVISLEDLAAAPLLEKEISKSIWKSLFPLNTRPPVGFTLQQAARPVCLSVSIWKKVLAAPKSRPF